MGKLTRTIRYNDFFDGNRAKTFTAKDAGYAAIQDVVFTPSGKGVGVLFKDEFDVFDATDGSRIAKHLTLPDTANLNEELLSALFVGENEV